MTQIQINVRPAQIALDPQEMAELVEILTEHGIGWSAQPMHEQPKEALEPVPRLRGNERQILLYVAYTADRSSNEIAAAFPEAKSVSATLTALWQRGLLMRTGSRKRDDPYRYAFKNTAMNAAILDQASAEAAREKRAAPTPDRATQLREELAEAAE